MDREFARTIALQDAEALELLGVNFVPMSRNAPGWNTEPVTDPVAESAGDSERASRQKMLDEILARYEADAPHQHFPTDHTRIVFGDGDPCARLMFVGEAPGADEDREGIPFVGRSGALLNQMIEAMGLGRDRVYICNVLKVRPPGNATPTPEQAALCAPYLYDQIRVIRPEVIVTLGRPASQLLLERTDSMRDMRGRWFEFPPPDGIHSPDGFDARIPVMPTYHPAFLLRQRTVENRRKVWNDLKLVMDRLGLEVPNKAR